MRRTIIACVAVALIAGATSATAASLITSKDIKNGTIKARDIKKGGVTESRLGKKLRAKINAAGTGAQGAPGVPGPKGDAGAKGADGKDAVTQVTGLSTDANATTGWVGVATTGCGPGGTVGLADGKVKFGPLTDGDMAASLFSRDFAGVKLQDIAQLAYTTKYDQTGTDQHGGQPCLRIFLQNNDRLIYSPNTQYVNPYDEADGIRQISSNDWDRHDVTEGVLRYNDDGGDGSGPYGVVGAPWDRVVADHGDEVVSRIVISAGCSGAYSANTTAYVDNVELDVAGERSAFDFGG